MPSEIEQTIKNVAEKIGKYIQDAATLTVQTDYLNTEGAADFAESKAAALPVIKLDGDGKTVVPGRQTDDGPAEIESGIFGLHQQNVTTAIDRKSTRLNSSHVALSRMP